MRKRPRYKYIHILWHFELKFTTRVVEFINNPKTGIDGTEHLFVTPFKNVYDHLKQYDNVEFVETRRPMSAKVVNMYAKRCEWLILHNICSRLELLQIKKKYIGKIIWRSWGGGRLCLFPKHEGQLFKNFVKDKLNNAIITRVRSFAAVGIANVVDEIELENKFGKLRFMPMPYTLADGYAQITEAANKERAKRSTINVMIGHSAHEVNNHIGILDKLSQYKDDNIQIYMILSYGSKEYAQKVISHAKSIFGEKLIVIDSFLSYADYIELLVDMDIAIFDGKVSYALGNIAMLLYLKKKIFLNESGIIRAAFERVGIPCCTTNSIKKMSFNEFSTPLSFTDNSWEKLSVYSFQQAIDCWHEILKTFN